MKSSFLVTLVLSALITNVASAQVAQKKNKNQPKKAPVKTKVVKKAATTSTQKTEEKVETKSGFNKFMDRLKISYSGALTTPNFRDIKDGHWTNAAISPQWDLEEDKKNTLHLKNRDTVPTNLYNQVSFNYNFGAMMNFVVNPRFSIQLAPSRDMEFPEDKGAFVWEDTLVGFQGVVLSSEDKKFNLFTRPGIRLPTSKLYRNSTNRGDGYVTYQIDITYDASYTLNNSFQVGVGGQWRQWVIEDNYSFRRVRLSTNPYVQYTINDVSTFTVTYENSLETDSRGKGETKIRFDDKWQNVMFAYGRDITPKFNLAPFIGCFVDTAPISDQAFWGGFNMSYKIK